MKTFNKYHNPKNCTKYQISILSLHIIHKYLFVYILNIILKMGTQQSTEQTQPVTTTPQQNPGYQQKLSEQHAAQLRILVNTVLKQLQNLKQDVKDFQYQMKAFKDRIRTDCFQGKVDSQGKPVGVVKFYQRVSLNSCKFYIGNYIDGNPSGRGMQILVNLISSKDQTKIQVDRQNYKVYILDNWAEQTTGQQSGSVLSQQKQKTMYFRGQLSNFMFRKGNLKILKNEKIVLEYIGEFKNNQIDGQGTLIIPQRSQYSGKFERSEKWGCGIQKDFLKKTTYVGEFEANKRHGYGELTYTNRDNVKLKGFWTDGIVEPGDGMYVNKDGQFLETITQDINTL